MEPKVYKVRMSDTLLLEMCTEGRGIAESVVQKGLPPDEECELTKVDFVNWDWCVDLYFINKAARAPKNKFKRIEPEEVSVELYRVDVSK